MPASLLSAPTSHSLHSGGALTPSCNTDMRFGRIFPHLPPWQPSGRSERDRIARLRDISLSLFPADGGRSENPEVASGYTYFGQLMAHDLSFDATSLPRTPASVPSASNPRTPRFDLDCVYGRGPADQPYLYDVQSRTLFRIGANGAGEPDLPRTDGAGSTFAVSPIDYPLEAVIADSRNDENFILSQLHLAVMRFHNRRVSAGDSFDHARKITTWHYQWLVLNDFLPRLCGTDTVDAALLNDGMSRFYEPDHQPFIPVEFAAAAFRYGHATVRDRYSLNDHLGRESAAQRPILRETANSLTGGRSMPSHWLIQWNHFFDTDTSNAQPSMAIAPALPSDFRWLPRRVAEAPTRHHANLAFRTLLRGVYFGLPAGQSVARCMDVAPLPGDDPLWIYVLREADELRSGRQLGPVGSRLVATVVVGLLLADRESYLNADPAWRPATTASAYRVVDFLRDAGMPIDSDDWRSARRLNPMSNGQ